MRKQFGGKLTKNLAEKYASSPNWKNGKFKNLAFTSMSMKPSKIPGLLYKQIFDTKGRIPKTNLPVTPINPHELLQESDFTKMIWYGHSALLLRTMGKTLLIDPMLGPNAAPIAPFKVKRFSNNTLNLIDDLPEIDLLLLSHDHYDHLDLASFKKLKSKVKHYYVALGTERHLVSWGVDPEHITTFDWWENHAMGEIDITFTPSRHFSGRGLSDRFKSLWGGWVIKTPSEKIYFSGDGGYGDHFKEVGKRLGPFDFGLMECGQYNKLWHQIHMFPEEAVYAALDAGVITASPVHWGGFSLALHTWKDPIHRFVKKASEENLTISTPKLGELFQIHDPKTDPWWDNFI